MLFLQGARYTATMQQYKASWHNVRHNKDLTEDERKHPFRFTRGKKQSSLEGAPGDNYRAKVEVNKFVTVSVQYIAWNKLHFLRINLQFITDVWLMLLMRLKMHSVY